MYISFRYQGTTESSKVNAKRLAGAGVRMCQQDGHGALSETEAIVTAQHLAHAMTAVSSRFLLSFKSILIWSSGFYGINQSTCEARGCCWIPGDGPWCFFRNSNGGHNGEAV